MAGMTNTMPGAVKTRDGTIVKKSIIVIAIFRNVIIVPSLLKTTAVFFMHAVGGLLNIVSPCLLSIKMYSYAQEY